MTQRGYHDIGGLPAEPVERIEAPMKHWEWETEAIRAVLGDSKRQLVSLDEIRRLFETFGEEKYYRGFHERRTEAMVMLLIEKGVITRDELDARVAVIRKRLGLDG